MWILPSPPPLGAAACLCVQASPVEALVNLGKATCPFFNFDSEFRLLQLSSNTLLLLKLYIVIPSLRGISTTFLWKIINIHKSKDNSIMNPYLWIDHLNYQLMFHLPLPPSTPPPIPTPSPPDYSERNPSLHMIPPTGNLSLNLLQKTGGVVCSSNFSTSLRHQGYWGDFIIYFLFIYN